MRPSNSSRITLPPPTSLVLAGRSGFCGSVPKAMMVPPPPPPAVGVVEVGVVLPPQAESTRARDAAPAAAVTQRARTELPRIDPPRDSKGLRVQHRPRRPPPTGGAIVLLPNCVTFATGRCHLSAILSWRALSESC